MSSRSYKWSLYTSRNDTCIQQVIQVVIVTLEPLKNLI
jgi:hypothetical protein